MKKIQVLMTAKEMDQAITRIAQEILQRNPKSQNILLVGIRTGGVPLAQRIKTKIKKIEKIELPVGILDITLYRDDWSSLSAQPIVRKTEIPVSVNDRVIILIDDVIFTGRTVRAALDALIDFGRPKRIELAILIDRGWRELPIQPDYVGKRVKTNPDEHVNVLFKELGSSDEVVLERP